MVVINMKIHDNEIKSYSFNMLDRKLVFKTILEEEIIDIVFYNVLAYSFSSIEEQNLISEITETKDIDGFVSWYFRKMPKSSSEFGLPIENIRTAKELRSYLRQEKYCYFEINATVGLDGYVIAKNMSFISY